MNFYRPKEVSRKKMASGGHTRCPGGRGVPRGVGRALSRPDFRDINSQKNGLCDHQPQDLLLADEVPT